MKAECPFEREVLDAVAEGRHDPGETRLRAHVVECRVCADLAEVARALLEDGRAARSDARLPSAGLVWWRAQLRTRQEAQRVAARPLTVVQALAASAVAGLACALFGVAFPWVRESMASLKSAAEVAHIGADPTGSFVLHGNVGWLIAALAVWLVGAPLVIYFTVQGD